MFIHVFLFFSLVFYSNAPLLSSALSCSFRRIPILARRREESTQYLGT